MNYPSKEEELSMQIVYLDQNKWIQLARVAYGKDTSKGMGEVLDFVRASRDMSLACYPLSFAHYMEIYKDGKAERRLRLAAIMREVSGGLRLRTLARSCSTRLTPRSIGGFRIVYGQSISSLLSCSGRATRTRAVIQNSS